MPTHRPPLSDDPDTLATFKNLYLQSDLGQLDIHSAIDEVGSYEHVRRRSTAVDLGGLALRVLNLDALIRAKAAMSRPKDRQALAELQALLERHRPQE
jgi:predicted nucleotidyltransferase